MARPQSIRRFLVVNGSLAAAVWCLWLVMTPGAVANLASHWQVAVTMVFGSLIAGATSEGGGAVAFPVFTKVLHIAPRDAKVFALAIQSVGMTAASLGILAMRVRVDWRAVVWASTGGAVGMLLGLHYLAPYSSPPIVRILFTTIQVVFGLTLLLINKLGDNARARRTQFDLAETKWILALTGLVGGMAGSLTGNGIDIVTFSVLVVLFRVSEKVATPTSVLLMAVNAVVGFTYCLLTPGLFHAEVQAWWQAAIPVVVIGAPAGALVCAFLRRDWIVWMLLLLISIELVTSLWLIPMTPPVVLTAFLTIVVSSTLYFAMSRCRRYWPRRLTLRLNKAH